MMKKRNKKRYETANAIRDEIDRCRTAVVKLQQTAEAMEIQAAEYFKIPEMVEDAAYRKEQAKRARKKAARLNDIRLVKLKDKLSEFMTQTLPGIIPDEDRSIQA